MKKILLASVALTAFAGAAAAEVSFGGSMTLGYNDDSDINNGTKVGDFQDFYWEGSLNAKLSQELDNGIAAGVSFNFEFTEEDDSTSGTLNGGMNLNSDDVVLSLTSDMASIYFGDTGTAANSLWVSAGDMEADGFTSDPFDSTSVSNVSPVEAVLRGDLNYGAVTASVSTTIVKSSAVTGSTSHNEADQLSAAVKADLGMATVVVAYEDKTDTTVTTDKGDWNADEIFGLSVGFSAAGADFVVAYAEQDALGVKNESTGLKVTYPMGDLKFSAYYVNEDAAAATVASNARADDANYGVNVAYASGAYAVALDFQDDQGVQKVSLDGSYDMGNGLTLLAGVYDEDGNADATKDGTDTYVAAEYSLGGGAALLVSYADANTATAIGDDEVGAPDYQAGTTVALTFAF